MTNKGINSEWQRIIRVQLFKNSLAVRFPSSCYLLTPDPCMKLASKTYYVAM